jgi:site-specific DNA-methyltransferase (adenine-specific)
MRSERERLGLTRIELETRIFGRSDGNVRNWEDGISIPRPGLWPKIREALDLSSTPFDADMERGDTVVGEVAGSYGYQKDGFRWTENHELREPITDLARQWTGWGTALKPAHEPILLFQKPYSDQLPAESPPMTSSLLPDDKTRWVLHNGNCLDVLRSMPDESVDSVITDPPYGLSGHSAADVQEALRAWLDGKPYESGSLRKGQENCATNILGNAVISDTDGSNSSGQQENISFSVLNKLSSAVCVDSVNLNHESTIGEIKVRNESSAIPFENVLVGDRNPNLPETGNSHPFSLRKRQGFTGCVGVCTCHTESGPSLYRVNVWLRHDPLSESERASREVALTGTEVRAVLTLDVAKKTAQISLTEITPDHDCGLVLVPPHLVGALTGASGLSPETQSSGVSLVGAAANGTGTRNKGDTSNDPTTLLATGANTGLHSVEGPTANFTVLLHTEYLTRLRSPTLGKKGFMGKGWDAFVPGPEVWKECFRVLKPGGHLLAFAGTRTQDLMGIAIRLAGFDCRDEIRVEGVLAWEFGSGFPKSRNISKTLDKQAGVLEHEGKNMRDVTGTMMTLKPSIKPSEYVAPEPITDDAKQWEGWGTALKPSHEPILMFRKPMATTVAENVQRYGTGAINVDGCRVETIGPRPAREPSGIARDGDVYEAGLTGSRAIEDTIQGRWPSNLVLVHTPSCVQTGTQTVDSPVINRFNDGMKPFGEGAGHAYTSVGGGQEEIPVWECVDGCPVKALDGQSGVLTSGSVRPGYMRNSSTQPSRGGFEGGFGDAPLTGFGDSGGASRFFPQFQYTPEDAPFRYVPKTGRTERNEGLEGGPRQQVDDSRDPDAPGANNPRNRGGRQDENHHSTVKPIELMRWLIRLVTPPGGIVLDPFNGSGSTGCAAIVEGMLYVGIDLDPDYIEISRGRIEWHGIKIKGGLKRNPWVAPVRTVQESAVRPARSAADFLCGYEDEDEDDG